MRIPFSFLFLTLVLAEIATFILVGGRIGVFATLGLTLLGTMVGVLALRWQGVATLMRIRAEMAAGRTPARPLLEGAVLAIAAFFLILPGFISDFVGLLLFIPTVREILWRWVSRRITFSGGQQQSPAARPPAVVDLDQSEYRASPRRDSPWRQDGEVQT